MRYEYRSHDLLDTVIEWITTNLNPSDVFDEDILFEWARENASDAEEVCADSMLHRWAMESGYEME